MVKRNTVLTIDDGVIARYRALPGAPSMSSIAEDAMKSLLVAGDNYDFFICGCCLKPTPPKGLIVSPGMPIVEGFFLEAASVWAYYFPVEQYQQLYCATCWKEMRPTFLSVLSFEGDEEKARKLLSLLESSSFSGLVTQGLTLLAGSATVKVQPFSKEELKKLSKLEHGVLDRPFSDGEGLRYMVQKGVFFLPGLILYESDEAKESFYAWIDTLQADQKKKARKGERT